MNKNIDWIRGYVFEIIECYLSSCVPSVNLVFGQLVSSVIIESDLYGTKANFEFSIYRENWMKVSSDMEVIIRFVCTCIHFLAQIVIFCSRRWSWQYSMMIAVHSARISVRLRQFLGFGPRIPDQEQCR